MNQHWTKGLIAAAAAFLRRRALAQSAAFRFFGPLSRVITPNGDGINDLALICFDNPQDSKVGGKIYSLLRRRGRDPSRAALGRRRSSPLPLGSRRASQYLSWDGKGPGGTVHSGVYVYRVRPRNKIYLGTIMVVR